MLQTVHGGANARPFLHPHQRLRHAAVPADRAGALPQAALRRRPAADLRAEPELPQRGCRRHPQSRVHLASRPTRPTATTSGCGDLTRELDPRGRHRRRRTARRAPARTRTGNLIEVDLSGPWRSVTVHDAVSAALGTRVDAGTTLGRARRALPRARSARARRDGRGGRRRPLRTAGREDDGGTDLLPRLPGRDVAADPTPPDAMPRLAERWDLVAFGMEIGTAYSELIDPVEQRARLSEQSLAAADGDPEAMETRRGVPRRARIRHAADWRARPRRRPAGHDADRRRRSGRRWRSRSSVHGERVDEAPTRQPERCHCVRG